MRTPPSGGVSFSILLGAAEERMFLLARFLHSERRASGLRVQLNATCVSLFGEQWGVSMSRGVCECSVFFDVPGIVGMCVLFGVFSARRIITPWKWPHAVRSRGV